MPKILLVEDNEINRDMLSRRLERKGYEVIIAINGAEGVAIAQSDQPDLVLMDMHLPVLDGWSATRQLKANSQTRGIPVIALTADAIAGEREKALAAGCDDYDTKPVDLPRLLEKITKLLEPPASQPLISPPPAIPNLPSDQRRQRLLLTHLRRDFDPLIHSIIGYSDMLLETVVDQKNQALYSDLQKIDRSGIELLRLVEGMLNPVLVEIQQQQINLLAPALRLELLTPLSTIIGYCEMLLEEAPADLVADLEQIYTSAQGLLSRVNSLDALINQHLKSIDAAGQPSVKAWERHPTLETAKSTIAKESRILVVDDNDSSCLLLSRQLERQGCQVATTTNQQALSAIAATSYDLILLDISSSSDLQVLEQLKGNGKWQHIPVLIMAAPDQMELVAQGIAIGAADYLTRPFQSVLVRTKVIACLEQRRSQIQSGNFDHLLEYAPVGVYQATTAGYFKSVNPSLVRLLGYPTAATLIEKVTNIAEQIYVDANRYAEFKSLLDQHDQVIGFEYQAYRQDGDQIWVAEHARAVRDFGGQVISYEGIVEEITHRKLAEAALNQQLSTLELELEQIKHTQQVAEIVQTDYFQQLQSNEEAKGETTLPLKVLLIEDNELNCDMLSRRLQRSGYQVVIAGDGAAGVDKALSEQPHVILMDISLPVMDGWEATQHLKANPQTCRIPIIALTAHAMSGDREKALAAGCDDYDTKPIELPRLLSKIENCLKSSTSG
ncbi:MAG: response regulator [Aphanocapsa sp. GSE-SYN-MK-11-07L]|jgi:PAS domain S-box-containing protein|nr:response regulator [Aphanocapsa sp. GSE-SYN-MK-11-07L]